MKTVKYSGMPYQILDEIKCPYCEAEKDNLDVMIQDFYMQHQNGTRIYNFTLHSVENCQKSYKDGQFIFCNYCKEIFFAYIEQDTRKCNQCKHCSRTEDNSRFKCNWFNRKFSHSTNIDSCTHCENIDCNINSDEIRFCEACKFFDINKRECKTVMNYGYRFEIYAPLNFDMDKELLDNGCMEFVPNLENYKIYRKKFDGLLFDEGKHIPEFDEIKE